MLYIYCLFVWSFCTHISKVQECTDLCGNVLVYWPLYYYFSAIFIIPTELYMPNYINFHDMLICCQNINYLLDQKTHMTNDWLPVCPFLQSLVYEYLSVHSFINLNVIDKWFPTWNSISQKNIMSMDLGSIAGNKILCSLGHQRQLYYTWHTVCFHISDFVEMFIPYFH